MALMFRVEEVSADGGERLVVLRRADDGQPPFWPNVFVTSLYRNSGKAVNTIRRACYTLALVYSWAEARRMDLDAALVHGALIPLHEVEDLAVSLRLRADALEYGPPPKESKLRSLAVEKARRSQSEPRKTIDVREAQARLGLAAAYIQWHVDRRIARLTHGSPGAATLQEQAARIIRLLGQLCPSGRRTDDELARDALNETQLACLLEGTDPDSPRNPFRSNFLRLRNDLLTRTFVAGGMRAGEQMGVKVEDLNWATGSLKIHRDPDAPGDPRKREVNTKTYARTVHLGSKLSCELRDFVVNHWAKIPAARKHGFLWTTESGRPLSQSQLNDIFVRMRTAIPGLPRDFSPHVLRYTWNYVFSKTVDAAPREKAISAEQEARIREAQMGWVQGSKMAGIYNRRHDRKRADEIAEAMANAMVNKRGKKK